MVSGVLKDVLLAGELKVHRTSSSRKLRRKNEGTDAERSLLQLSLNQINKQNQVPQSKLRKIFEKLKCFGRSALPHPVTFSLALLWAVVAFVHLTRHFQKSTRFEELSDLEKQVSLPTNVALSYGYFKRIAVAESYVQGLLSVTRDGSAETANSFQRFSLAPQVILAGGFHALQAVSRWTGWPIRKDCLNLTNISSLNGEEEGYEKWEETQAGGGRDLHDLNLICAGPGNPLDFYLTTIRVFEACAVLFIFYLGLELSASLMGGISAAALTLLLHPQGGNYEWMFPLDAKIGWICALLQLSTVSRSVFLPAHPPWSATVKVGIWTAVLICCWNKEAQWLLTSQLLIVTLVHIFGFLSRYRASLIIFGQLVGWEWASLVSLDVSFHHWSFFLYALLATSLTLVVVEPIVDWVLGKKRDKWSFFRRTILLITLQSIIIAIRFDLAQFVYLHEDSRFPLSSGDCLAQHPIHFKSHLPPKLNNCPSLPLKIPPLDLQKRDKASADLELKNVSDLLNRKKSEEVKETQKEEDAVASAGSGAHEKMLVRMRGMSEFVRDCLKCDGVLRTSEMLRRKGWIILTALYSIFASLALPRMFKWIFPAQDIAEDEEGETGKNFGLGLRKNWGGLEWLWVGLIGKREEKGEKWEGLILYHIAQTLFVGIFCAYVDEGWEILFLTQLVLLISLLADFQGMWKQLKLVPFTYAKHLHWVVLAALLAIVVANTRLQSNQHNVISRGRFEVGNERVRNLVEGIRWIHQNAPNATFGGPHNLLTTLKLTLSPNPTFKTINPHLGPHSWANSNPTPKSRLNESEPWPWGAAGGGNGGEGSFKETTVLTAQETRGMTIINSIFSRTQTITEFHEHLMSLNVTHFLLTPHLCPNPHPHPHPHTYPPSQSRFLTPSTSHQTKSSAKWVKDKRNPSEDLYRGVWEGVEDGDGDGDGDGGEGRGRSKAFWTLDDEKMEGGWWQWKSNWQEPEHSASHLPPSSSSSGPAQAPPHLAKKCDLISLWERLEGVEREKENEERRCRRRKVGVSNWVEEELELEGVEEEEQDEEEPEENTLCYRLLNERNLLPFKRVFQNSFITILSLHPPPPPPPPLSPPTSGYSTPPSPSTRTLSPSASLSPALKIKNAPK